MDWMGNTTGMTSFVCDHAWVKWILSIDNVSKCALLRSTCATHTLAGQPHCIYVMHSNETGNKSQRPILRYGKLKLLGRKIIHLFILRILFLTCLNVTFVNCRHLKKIFTAPWLKNFIEYSYLLPKYSVKILQEKKWAFSFYFTFCKMGILHVSLWRVAL